jgi:vancomycin permeability regulator SanA
MVILSGLGVFSWVLGNYSHTFTRHAECAVIFGAAVWRDDIPSHALFDRTMSGVQLFKENKVECLILSGGPSKIGTHEVGVMRKLAFEQGVPVKNIRTDFKGLNTLATLKNLPKDVDSFVMVSNDFHLARIRMLAWKLGIKNVDFHAAQYHSGRYREEFYYFVREMGGVVFYFLGFES